MSQRSGSDINGESNRRPPSDHSASTPLSAGGGPPASSTASGRQSAHSGGHESFHHDTEQVDHAAEASSPQQYSHRSGGSSQRQPPKETQQLSVHAGLELEHALGFAGEVFDGLHFLPNDGDTYIYPAGACIVMAKLSDPHQQTFLRGHDEPISCLQLSPKGNFIASGQTGDQSDVIVWDTQSCKLLYRFQEHDYGIAELEFSDDERLLISAGVPLDNRMYIWDLATGCINAHVSLDPCPTLSICFGKMYRDFKKRLTGLYQFATLGEGSLCVWALDPVQGLLTRSKMEKSDLGREIACAQFDGDMQEYIYGGTSSGEIIALHIRSLQPAMSSMICSAGIGAIKWIHNGIVAGGGDGSLIKLGGKGANLVPEMRLYLQGGIRSLSLRPSEFCENSVVEVATGSTSGKIYHVRLDPNINAKDLAHTYPSAMSTMRDRPPSSVRSGASHNTKSSGSDKPSMDPRIMLVSEAHALPGADVDEGAGSVNARGVGNLSMEAGTGVKTIHQTEVSSISFAPDSSEQFATAGSDNSIRAWDMNEYMSTVLVKERDAGHPECIDYSYDMLVSGWDDRHIRCYLTDLKEDPLRESPERELWTLLNAHKTPISAVKVARNQRFMMSGGREGAVRVWNLRNRELVSDLMHHSSKISRIVSTTLRRICNFIT
eukprot:gb/GECG01009315.1/.p1 GENE.gb/GECG01009315.1/~~gb/GECG01009315.1/.p1  ORF type:complete len:660 (+),score=67.10 gb/GECG01009315.1/:1-1980(+)